MASDNEGAKTLLLIACIFGALQGLLTLIGGIITSFDSDKSVVFKSYCSSIMTTSGLNGICFFTGSLSRIDLF